MMRALILELTPSRLISRLTGMVTRCPIPRPLRPLVMGIFCRLYRVNREEIADPLDSFPTLAAFFIRRLKEGSRPIDPTPGLFVSPVDARITSACPLAEMETLTAKGARYTPTEILGDPARAETYRDGYQITLYLCPTDYHRIHSPYSGAVVAWRHIRGRLFPVNPPTLAVKEKVYPGNERVISYWENQEEKQRFCLIMVGALNVGSMHSLWDPSIVTNRSKLPSGEITSETPRRFAKGEEAARFQFGSTVVLLFPRDTFIPVEFSPNQQIRLGEKLGTWK